MKLPQVKGSKAVFPGKPLCPVCRKKKVFEPNSFAVVSGGALQMDRRRRIGSMSDALDAFLELHWHGAHDGGEGGAREIGVVVPIAESVRGGLFDIYVCSPRCLRRLFNSLVDAFEGRIKKAHAERKRRAV